MARITISEHLITSLAKKNNKDFVKQMNEKINNLLALSIENLASQVSYISLDTSILQPVNELFNDSMVDSSEFAYVLGVESAQLDLNTMKKSRFWENLKTRLKRAWQSRKMFKKKKRKKRKKKNEEPEISLDVKFDPTKYNVYSLTEDLQNSICQYLSPTSIVYQGNNKIEIIGKEDLGPNIKVVVYVVSLVDGEFKYYTGKRKNPFINLKINERYAKLKAKKKSAGANYTKVLKVFNALYFNFNGKMPNQLFMESILDSIPDNLFEGKDFYKVFVKIVNYISIKTIKKIPSILNPDKSIWEDQMCGECGLGFNKIIQSFKSEEELAVKKEQE